MTDRLTDPVDDVTTTIVVLGGITEHEWTTGTIAELARCSQQLRRLQSIIRDADKAIEDTLVGSMETDLIDIAHVGRVNRVERTQSTWRYKGAADQMRDDLARAVATSLATDIQTGEINANIRNISIATMRLAYDAIPSFSNLLKAGRERLGLHIGDYREHSTHYTITIEDGEDES